MSEYMVNWITMALVILLPMIPAFCLYRFLPAQGEVGGKLFGLPIKLTGSIAGYVVVLLLCMNFSSYDEVAGRDKYELVTLSGSIRLDGLAADEVDYRLLDIAYVPRREEVSPPYGEGMVDWNTFVIQPVDQRHRAIADVLISYNGYRTEKLTLSSATDTGSNRLRFEPVILQKKRPTASPTSGETDVVVLDNP